ncbi:fumarylacetoacetate hydrolase family protein [Saccharopolyspora elongata]|uniref:FAA hydrolase family protein n=1 Tax=Saccharopolyspora elongata TaxID=2530387 RepID=A0A4R4YET8_9PSEU|nr:fumarylacetoacetate hydrolase family protein [Saccharopolyspora elongata]TDD42424.1 FAA hydrolase family protein [Saccharopolyspora elongata]
MRLYATDQGIAREDTSGILALLGLPASDLSELLTGDGITAARTAQPVRDVRLESVTLRPVLSRPGKFLAVGLNYPSHAEEALEKYASIGRHDVALPTEPNVQIAAGSAVTGHGMPIVLPPVAATHVDFEGEVAIVIGRKAADVDPLEAWQCVAGLTVINDVTARDIQRRAYAGDPVASIGVAKSFDTFKPLGPCLVTADEFTEPMDLRLRTWVNGELRQYDRTSNFLYSIPDLIAYVSRYQTLEPGDVIATGSPRGAGQFTERFLRPGDVVEIEVERIGTLSNRVSAA